MTDFVGGEDAEDNICEQETPCALSGKKKVDGEYDWMNGGIKYEHKAEVANRFPLPNGNVRMTIIGGSGTGKSTVLLRLIPCFTDLSYIVVCSKIVGLDVYDAIEKYCEENVLKYYFAKDPYEAAEAIEKAVKERDEGTYGLLILDDFTDMKSRGSNSLFTQVALTSSCMLRNMGAHCCYITQDLQMVPTPHRCNTTCLIAFKSGNPHANRGTFQLFSTLSGMDKEPIISAYNQIVGKVPHSFLIYTRGKVYAYHNQAKKLLEIEPEAEESEETEDGAGPAPMPNLDSRELLETMKAARAGLITPTKIIRWLKEYARLHDVDIYTLRTFIQRKYGFVI